MMATEDMVPGLLYIFSGYLYKAERSIQPNWIHIYYELWKLIITNLETWE
jgi:hypothetical protein